MSNQPANKGYVRITKAAKLLGIDRGQVRRRCKTWAPNGLAKKDRKGWLISPKADQRLRGGVDADQRDTEQLGLLRDQAVPESRISTALKRRSIVRGFSIFQKQCGIRDRKTAVQAYVSRVKSKSRIRVSASTYYEWQGIYRREGIIGLLPKYGWKNKPRANRSAMPEQIDRPKFGMRTQPESALSEADRHALGRVLLGVQDPSTLAIAGDALKKFFRGLALEITKCLAGIIVAAIRELREGAR